MSVRKIVKTSAKESSLIQDTTRFSTIIDTLLLGLGILIGDTKRFIVVMDVLVPRTDLTPEENTIVQAYRNALERISNELTDLEKVGKEHVDQVLRSSSVVQTSGSSQTGKAGEGTT